MSRPQPFPARTGPAAAPGLAFAYAPAETLARQLADDRVLAAFGFGDAAPASDDPRWLRVPLAPLGDGPPLIEVWRGEGRVERGRDGDVAWASDGQLLFAALEVDEAASGIEAAAERAYARMAAFMAGCDTPHLLRIWNYMDAITLGEGDEERYRRFCVGRVAGMGGLEATRLPAATAIGSTDGRRRLQVYWLASREPGTPVENPRQVSAYRYPRQYGPQAPSFARAMLPPAAGAMPLLLSGTAAIVGHASQHSDSVHAQLDETLANIDSVIATARRHAPQLPASPGAGSLLKVYVRDRGDAPAVAAHLSERLDPAVPRLLLHAQVCRRELRVEIDGVHGPAAG
ncbi:chorismate transformation enzyme, FkbO/Hyg5 family [Pseudoxanthomonas sp. 10H]|uniref:chorismate transformation enzyme, FkbO/Hyg5 family n=1 Tax=Pseudoxanthomonas sp. 10H TaxID=3242729 RepID=UPI00355929E1